MQVLQSLDSQKKLERFATEDLKFVEPLELILGHTSDNKPETMQYVSLAATLKKKECMEDVKHYITTSVAEGEGLLRDVCDGQLFSSRDAFSVSPCLPLLLYADEFTICNPLRSQGKSYKIMAVYVQIASLPVEKRSKLETIHLVSLCRSEFVKKYGMNAYLQPLVDELNLLNDQGVEMTVNDEQVSVPCQLFLCIADNLGAHQLCGFVESFSANHPRRFCHVSRENMLAGRVGVPRNIASHNTHLDQIRNAPLLRSLYGVNGRSPLADVPGFNCTESLPSDIAHDIFEGVAKFYLNMMIKLFVRKGYISVDELNREID